MDVTVELSEPCSSQDYMSLLWAFTRPLQSHISYFDLLRLLVYFLWVTPRRWLLHYLLTSFCPYLDTRICMPQA